MKTAAWFSLVVAVAAFPSRTPAARPVPLKRLAVDCVTIKDGPRLLGAVLERSSEGDVTIAVQRTWLEKSSPKFYKEERAKEQQAAGEAQAALRKQLEAWKARRAGDERLLDAIDRELERLEKPRAQQPESQFLILTIPAKRIRIQFQQPFETRRIAALAWRERLAGVESRSAAALLRELKEKKLDPANEAVDLSDRLPSVSQDETSWAARQALFEYTYRQPLDFQGSGDLLVRTDGKAGKHDMAGLVNQALQAKVGSQLAELLGETAPKKAAKREFDSAKTLAEREGILGFRVTRVAQDVVRMQVSVESQFLFRTPDGGWATLWKDVQTADASKDRKDLQDRIAKDPQVRKVFDVLGAAKGELGAAANTALKFGAATMQAQRSADDAFYAMLRRTTQRVDGPPLSASGDQ
jgi:hypothetical protein